MYLKQGRKLKRFTIGSNQYKSRNRTDVQNGKLLVGFFVVFTTLLAGAHVHKSQNSEFVSPYVGQVEAVYEAPVEPVATVSATLTPTPSELVGIVSYIAEVFEPEGKDVVVKAINCFYSESGLRSDAVGQNSDGPRSKDHGVAQLNDYWHNLTIEQKTEVKANIDKAYEIYKNNGSTFNPWYGKLCR